MSDEEVMKRFLRFIADNKGPYGQMSYWVDFFLNKRSTKMEQVFSQEQLPSDPTTWETWKKKVTTQATRIEGPFAVETSEGPLHCADGWLAMDARGYPYPIADDEFQQIYERV